MRISETDKDIISNILEPKGEKTKLAQEKIQTGKY